MVWTAAISQWNVRDVAAKDKKTFEGLPGRCDFVHVHDDGGRTL